MLTLIFHLQPRLLSGYNLRVNMKTFIHLICPYPAVAVHCTCILSCMVKIICQWTNHYQPVHWFRSPCNIWAFAVTDWGEKQFESLWHCFHCLKPELWPSLCCPFFLSFFLSLWHGHWYSDVMDNNGSHEGTEKLWHQNCALPHLHWTESADHE